MKYTFNYIIPVFTLLLLAVSAFIFHVAGGATVVSEYFKHESPAELAFSFSYCSADNKLGGNPAAINWQGEVAVIDVAISSNCGTT